MLVCPQNPSSPFTINISACSLSLCFVCFKSRQDGFRSRREGFRSREVGIRSSKVFYRSRKVGFRSELLEMIAREWKEHCRDSSQVVKLATVATEANLALGSALKLVTVQNVTSTIKMSESKSIFNDL